MRSLKSSLSKIKQIGDSLDYELHHECIDGIAFYTFDDKDNDSDWFWSLQSLYHRDHFDAYHRDNDDYDDDYHVDDGNNCGGDPSNKFLGWPNDYCQWLWNKWSSTYSWRFLQVYLHNIYVITASITSILYTLYRKTHSKTWVEQENCNMSPALLKGTFCKERCLL